MTMDRLTDWSNQVSFERNKLSGINRIIKQNEHQFTMVPNKAVRDPELTSNAFRLLSYLLSHENGYELVYEQIMRQTDLGKYAIQKAISLLEEKGFLLVEQSRTDSGYWSGHNYILLDPYKENTGIHREPNQSVTDTFRSGTTRPHKEDKDIKKINNKKEDKGSPKDLISNEEFKKEIREKFPNIDVQKELESFFDWIAAKGVRYKDHKAAFRNWARKASQWNPTSTGSLDKERDCTAAYLREQERVAQSAVPPPKCEHGNTIALCRQCMRS